MPCIWHICFPPQHPLKFYFRLCPSCVHDTEHPKIRLPRQLRTKLIVRVGEKVNLVIPFQVGPSLAKIWLTFISVFEHKQKDLQLQVKTIW